MLSLCVRGFGEAGAQRLDIAHGGLAEKAAVLTTELAGAFITNFKGGAGRIESLMEHALPSDVQAQVLLILERAHGGECAEVMMERGDAHTGNLCEFFDSERFGVVIAKPGDGLGGSVALLAESGDGAEVLALRAAQQAVDDFTLDKRT